MAAGKNSGQSRGQSRGASSSSGGRGATSGTSNRGGTRQSGAQSSSSSSARTGTQRETQSSGRSKTRTEGNEGITSSQRTGTNEMQGDTQTDASRSEIGSQGASQRGGQSDQERQLNVTRENSGRAGGTRGSSMQSRGGRQDVGGLAGRDQSQQSILPALMANPWLMTNAFLSNPFAFTQAMNQEMDRLFSGGDVSSAGQIGAGTQGGRGLTALGGQRGRGASQWAPQLEVRERGNELVVCADLPGVDPNDVNIEVEDGVLTISGERQQSNEHRGEGNTYRSERSYGAFARSIILPEGVDEDQVRASFEHGVLEVAVPLPQQRQRSRRIEIQGGRGQSAGAGAGNRQSESRSRMSQSGASQSGTSQSGASQSGASQSRTSESAADQQGTRGEQGTR